MIFFVTQRAWCTATYSQKTSCLTSQTTWKSTTLAFSASSKTSWNVEIHGAGTSERKHEERQQSRRFFIRRCRLLHLEWQDNAEDKHHRTRLLEEGEDHIEHQQDIHQLINSCSSTSPSDRPSFPKNLCLIKKNKFK